MTERTAIRVGIPALLLTSTTSAVAVSLHTASTEIPAIAFGSQAVLAVQLTLLFFYAALLLLVPLVRALSDGALPIELSLRGARWSEEVGDLGDELLERLAAVEGAAVLSNLEIAKEVEELQVLMGKFRSGESHRNQELEG